MDLPDMVVSGPASTAWVRRWHPKAAEDWDLAQDAEEAIRSGIDTETIALNDLVLLRSWQELPNRVGYHHRRRVGQRYYSRAYATWVAPKPEDSHTVVTAVGGVYLLPDGEFWYSVRLTAINFDWAEAKRLLLRVDALAEQAREWWPSKTDGTGSDEDNGGDGSSTRSWRVIRRHRERRAEGRTRRADAQRQPHLIRAFSCMSGILSAIAQENATRPTYATSRFSPRAYSLVTSAFAAVDPSLPPPALICRSSEPSGTFKSHVDVLRGEADRADALLNLAAARTAQESYTTGMAVGTLTMLAVSAVAALAVGLDHHHAQYWIAIPAGALGALVSVFQRMTSGSLTLDLHAGRRSVCLFGIVRPIIGAIIAIAIYALLKGGVLPAIGASKIPLAFYAGVGFLAGFNERFAQDMLGGSVERMTIRALGTSDSA